ncbi:hypothetical protein DMC47_39980 [Nostoc sp. 3335mG]|nr:hypothetical protein DMC47_39980 [Nostoc sp. 3335mG]
MLDTLTADSFEPHVNTGFTVSMDGYDDVLTLVAVERGKAAGAAAREPFNLTFHGARTDMHFNQNVLPFEHPVLGRIEIFAGPFGKNEDGTFRYSATFN